MKTDDQGFHEDMRASKAATNARSAAIDEVGFAINDEMARISALQHTIEQRHKLVCGLYAVLREPYPTYLSEERRRVLEQGIVDELPRVLARAAQRHQPPPLPSEQRAAASA